MARGFHRESRGTGPLLAAALMSVAIGVATVSGASAQTITPRTVPVHMGQQFDILPSDRSGMAGVSIALDDTLLDPFVNPAKGTRLRNGLLSVAPYLHSVSNDQGGGRTLPISGVGSFGRWAAGGLFALQQLNRPRLDWDTPLSERTAANQYLMGLLAHEFGNGLALGGSAYWAELGAEEGVDLLYAGSDRIQQAGSSADFRLGLTKQWSGDRVLEAVVVRNRFDMTHDVHFPSRRVFTPPDTFTDVTARSEHHRDRTSTWGAHAEYSRPAGTQGWRIGFLGTVNRLSHPRIPDYRIGEVITVPRDPGHTWAYNAGVGFSRKSGNALFGIDLVLEPMYSTTWAEAARDTITAGGLTIRRGGHTVDNEFRFSNSLIRFGFEHDAASGTDSTSRYGVQFGLALYSIRYRLWQTDLVRDTSRVQDEHWMEWTPAIGFRHRTATYELRYTFSFTCGAGECMSGCFVACGDDVTAAPPPTPGGVIAAPTDQLRFQAGRVTTHRLSVSFRIR
jgi:hypothetical protein